MTPPVAGNSMSMSVPSIFIPEKEKDDNYHRQYIESIANRSISGGYHARNTLMNECLNFYLGLQTGEEFNFLQQSEDGSVLPAKWMDFNKIAVKIDLLLGELSQRGYKINVKAYNKEAQSRKMDEKNRLLNEMRFQPIAGALEEEFGLPIQQEGAFVPESQEQLDIYMDKSYKEKSELVMKGILSYLKKHCKWDYQRIALFRDLLIMGACFARHEIVDGIPYLERVDPRNMVFDPSAKDDFLSDAAYWGEIRYMTIDEVTNRWNLTRKELEEAFKDYQDHLKDNSKFSSSSQDFGFADGASGTPLFDTKGGHTRVLVCTAYWQDLKIISNKYSNDSYGQTHIKRVDEEDTGNSVKKTLIQMWRTGTLIGGKFLRDQGYLANQDRSVDNIATTTPPYTALIPNFLNGAIVSKVHRLKPLQNLKNIALYNLQFEMARSGGKVFFYDVSQLPKGWDIHTAMKYAKVAGIAFIDSAVEGAGPHNQFKSVDMSVSASFTHFLEVSAFLDREMDSVSGVNEARQGLIQGASQAVGVTNSALLQSSLSTAMYYTLFGQFFTTSMNKQAGLAKIAWAGKERFSPIIGDVGVDFLKEDVGLELNDYNVFIEEVPPVIADQQLFYQLVVTAIQSQQLSFMSGLKLLMEKDMDEAMAGLEMEMKRAERAQMAAAGQQQQGEAQKQQADMARQQAIEQSAQNIAQMQSQAKMQQANMQGRTDIQKIIAQAKLDLMQANTKFKQDLALKKIDAAIQLQKNKEKATKPKKQ
jgi:hypothetical protein